MFAYRSVYLKICGHPVQIREFNKVCEVYVLLMIKIYFV